MRPDGFGIVAWVEKTDYGDTYIVDEVVAGAFDRKEVKEVLRKLGAHIPLMVLGKDDKRSVVVKGK